METIYGFLVGGLIFGIYLLFNWLKSRNRGRKEKKLGAKFKAAYDKFIAEHGELYESATAPFDDEDRKVVNRYHNVIVIFLLPFTAGFFVMLYLSSSSNLEDILSALFFGLILVAAYSWSFYNRRKLLSNNQKKIIKGVITYKRIDSSDESTTYHFTISEKDSVMVSQSDYKKFTYGDIIKLEVLGSSLTSTPKYKISLLGKMEFTSGEVMINRRNVPSEFER